MKSSIAWLLDSTAWRPLAGEDH